MSRIGTRHKRQHLDTLAPKELLPALLYSGAWQLRHTDWRSYALLFAIQAIAVLIALPVIRWMFTEVLSAAGLHGFDTNTFGAVFEAPLSSAWLLGLVLLALLVTSLQLAALLMACALLRSTGRFSLRELGRHMAPLPIKALRPGSWVLLVYLFLILPLSQFGFLSALTNTIAIPSFISGELMKSTPGIVGYAVFLVVLFVVNVRLSLVLPLFALTDATGGAAFKLSWRLTRQGFPSLLAAVVAVFIAANVVGFTLIAAVTLPTALADMAAPGLSPAVAATGLALAEVLGLLIVGLTIIAVCGILLELLHRALPLAGSLRAGPGLGGAANSWSLAPGSTNPGSTELGSAPEVGTTYAGRRGRGKRAAWVIPAVLVVTVAGLAVINVPVMQALQVQPATLVLAHRGFSDGGVENTIQGLEAAAAAGADLVEMDVMETSDGQFVVMHDANLQRLAGLDLNVASLTLAEITSVQVTDTMGHSAVIPSFEDYLLRAKELELPLLVEIKLHGGEGPNLVPRLVAQMESLDAFSNNIFHSLSLPAMEELKILRPTAQAGYTMAFAGIAIPDTPVDFIVVEEWSYSSELRDDAWAAGKELYVWTVNSDAGLRRVLRESVDGIITDHPEVALAHREGIGGESGLFGTLKDAIARFVTVL